MPEPLQCVERRDRLVQPLADRGEAIDLAGFDPAVRDTIAFTLRYASFVVAARDRSPVIGEVTHGE